MTAPVPYGETIFYDDEQLSDPVKAKSHIDVTGLCYQTWTYLKQLRQDPTQEGSPLERSPTGELSIKDLSKFHESLKQCGALHHHVELVTTIFQKLIEKPPNPAASCNLFDILFLCLTDKFNSPNLESYIDVAAYPAAQFKALVELPLFGLEEATGKVIAHPNAPIQTMLNENQETVVDPEATARVQNPVGVFQRRKGLAAMLNLLKTQAANEESKALLPPGAASPSALSVSKDQNVLEAIKKWQTKHYKLTKDDLGSSS